MAITKPQAIAFSNTQLRTFSDKLSQLYNLAILGINYWNANGGSGVTNATTAPTGVAAAGGSFAAGTYSWRYTWLNAAGETLASAAIAAPIVVTLNQKVTVTIPALPPGATSANIYRGAVGAEGLVGNTTTTTFVDTGATAPGALVPTANTTGLIPNDSEVLQDSAATQNDGRPIVTGIQANNIINRMTDIKNLCEGNGAAIANDGSKGALNTVLSYAVNPNG